MIVGVTSPSHRQGDDDSETPDTWNIYGEADGGDAGGYLDVEAELVAGAAPNLTHLMTRGTFAGSAFDLYLNAGDDVPYLDLAKEDGGGTLNRGELEAWIYNAPERKPADADDLRGMPSRTGLTPEDIDDVVAFLSTLD